MRIETYTSNAPQSWTEAHSVTLSTR